MEFMMAAVIPEISQAALAEVYTHAREAHPEECCGFLIGSRDGVIDEMRRCENVQNKLHQRDPERFPRDARTAYNIGARDMIFADTSFQTERPVKIFYHSHVNVGAYFSAEDKRAALFGDEPVWHQVDYLVVGTQGKRVTEAKLFRWDEQQKEFVEIATYPGE
jgi:proteasome lid subunit RPN8/RPN11